MSEGVCDEVLRPGNGSLDDAFYKTLLDNLYDGVYFVDEDRCITFWNKGAERITGYAAPEVVGKRCSDDDPSLFDCRDRAR